jgi:7-cyano-7-deazaguanine synthase
VSPEADRAVVLLSGGLDSTVTAAIARQEGMALYCLTVAYGQRHAVEIERAQAVARFLAVEEHLIIEVNLRSIGESALTGQIDVPKDRRPAERAEGIPTTYVPARNTIFLALALAHAEARAASWIYFGANVLDYSGYPDCRPEFIRAFEAVARLGTSAGVGGKAIQVRAPLLLLSKADIVRRGADLHVPFELTHSCYDPDVSGTACGRCDSCLIRREGFRQAGVVDPVRYGVP